MTIRKRLEVLGKRLEEPRNENIIMSLMMLIVVLLIVAYIIYPLFEFIMPIIFLIRDTYYMAINELAYLNQFEIDNWLDEVVLKYSVYEIIVGCAGILISLVVVVIITFLKIVSYLLEISSPYAYDEILYESGE